MVTTVSKEKDGEDGLSVDVSAPPRDGAQQYTTWGDMLSHWPKTTLCIVSNEFCERFSYYGMRTVLTFYILNVLKFDENTSTIFFNSFTILCYLTPLLGSFIADGFIGKFWTIFSVSILYTIGQIMLAIASTQAWTSSIHPWLDLLGLVVIAFGTGGIKPCVSAFGADQFEQSQERMLSIYFSMFYFSINAGSMISTFISPIFRAQPCLGQDSCYPLSFGVPAVLMVCATGFFALGSPWYKKNPPTENALAEIFKIIGTALRNKFSSRNAGPTDHWLQHYLDTHDCAADPKCRALEGTRIRNKCQKSQYVDDVRALFKVIIMFVPVPFFWALYDQQGSIWLIQGVQMDCNVFGVLLLPDQMQTLNAVLILVFIPIFQAIIYPIFSKCIKLTPLRKMVAGGWMAALAFLITGFIQLQVNTTLPLLPKESQSFVSFVNTMEDNCTLNIYRKIDGAIDADSERTLARNESMVDIPEQDLNSFHVGSGTNVFTVMYSGDCNGKKQEDIEVTTSEKTIYFVAVNERGMIVGPAADVKPTEGTGEFAMGITMFTDDSYSGNLCVCRQDTKDFDRKHPCNAQQASDFYFWEIDYNQGATDFQDHLEVQNRPKNSKLTSVSQYIDKPVKPGKWKLYFLHNTVKDVDIQTPPRDQVNVTDTGIEFEIEGQGGVYNFVVTGAGYDPDVEGNNQYHVYQAVQDNKVNILWQVPQFVVITIAEILFSITGYEFAYSQSAPSMKSVVQALWLLTTAIGDAIIVLVTALNLFDDMAVQFFVYAAIMFVVICIYALMAQFYFDYQYYTNADEEEYEINNKSHTNSAFASNPWDIEDTSSITTMKM